MSVFAVTDLEGPGGLRLAASPQVRFVEYVPVQRSKSEVGLVRPLRHRDRQRLLDGVLGGLKVREAPGVHADDLRRQPAQQVIGVRIKRAQLPRTTWLDRTELLVGTTP